MPISSVLYVRVMLSMISIGITHYLCWSVMLFKGHLLLCTRVYIIKIYAMIFMILIRNIAISVGQLCCVSHVLSTISIHNIAIFVGQLYCDHNLYSKSYLRSQSTISQFLLVSCVVGSACSLIFLVIFCHHPSAHPSTPQ